MAKKKELSYYNGCLKGDYLTEKDCRILDDLNKLADENGVVEDLKHVIFELSNNDVDLIKTTKNSEFVEKPLGTLTDAQTVAVAYMYFSRRVVLGDSVGLGKTVEICGLMNLLEQSKSKLGTTFRFLYLTNKNLLDQSRDEMIKFTGEYVELLRGEKKYVNAFAEANGDELLYSVVGSHSLINSPEFQDYIRTYRAYYGVNPFDALVIDESDIIGNMSTATYTNGKSLSDDFDWVLIMNATAFESNLRNFYAQINFCDETLLPVKGVFEKLYEERCYTGPYPKFNGKYKNANIFREQVKYRYFKRTRKGLGAQMINCKAKLCVVDKSPIQKELLKKTGMPQMVIDCPSYFDKDVVMNEVNCPKLGKLLELINTDLKEEKTILVYVRYKEAQRGIELALTEKGINCEIMNGDTDLDVRNRIINRFKMGDFRVLITNVQKGLNFGNCNVCVFYTFDPNPNRMVQFEGRTTRSFTIEDKTSIMLVSKGKELTTLKTKIADRAEASDLFAGSDFSCILSLLAKSKDINGDIEFIINSEEIDEQFLTLD